MSQVRLPRKEKKKRLAKIRRDYISQEVDLPRAQAAARALPKELRDDDRWMNRFWRSFPKMQRNAAQALLRRKAKARGCPSVRDAFWRAYAIGLGDLGGWRVIYPWGRPAIREQREGLWHEERFHLQWSAKREKDRAHAAQRVAQVLASGTAFGPSAVSRERKPRKAPGTPCFCGHVAYSHAEGEDGWEDCRALGPSGRPCICGCFTEVRGRAAVEAAGLAESIRLTCVCGHPHLDHVTLHFVQAPSEARCLGGGAGCSCSGFTRAGLA